jgi:hypothetical protein
MDLINVLTLQKLSRGLPGNREIMEGILFLHMNQFDASLSEQFDTLLAVIAIKIDNTPDPCLDYQLGTFHAGCGSNI